MWSLKPNERLHEWKKFRTRISSMTPDIAMAEISHLWSYAPFVNHYLDSNESKDWPDPWTLLYENYYCDLAKALGMFYTIYLCDHYKKNINDLEIKIFRDNNNKEIFNTVWVDQGKYILNFTFDTVVNKNLFDEKLILTHSYAVGDLNLDLH